MTAFVHRRRSRLIVLMSAALLLTAACSSDGTADETAEPSTTTAASTTSAAPETTAAEEASTDETTTSVADAEPDDAEDTSDEEATGFDAVSEAVDAFVADAGLSGASLVVVHREEGIMYEEYFGDFAPDRISLIASSSKMISAGVLLALEEQGLLDMNAPISDQVDWATGNPEVTPAQLVSNSSGLVGLGPNLLYGPYLCQWGPNEVLDECATAVFTTEDDDSDQIAPDTDFRYGGAQWQVAGAVAESVSGKTWAELIDEIYVGPCGVDSLGYINLGSVVSVSGYPTVFGGDPDSVAPSANPTIEGGAHITATDYAELLLMHLRGGTCGDNQILSQASLDTMHADRVAEVYGGDAGDADTGYGMGWWVDRETGRISDGGAWGTVPWLDLDDGYGAYLVIEEESATGQRLKREIEELVHEAVTGA